MNILRALLIALLPLVSHFVYASDWMARLHPSTPLTALSIPGSHDTGTGNGFAPEWQHYGGRYNQTQDLSLAQQWSAGVRAFDLRPALLPDGRLHIFHGVMKTQLGFEEALRLLIDSVRVHSSEFAIVVFQHENDGDDGNSQWAPAVKQLLLSPAIRQYVVDYRPDLRVKDLRGRILLLGRTPYDEQPVGGFVRQWTSDEDFALQRSATISGLHATGQLYVQDYYDTSDKQRMQTKLFCLNRMFYTALQNPSARSIGEWNLAAPLVINHTSAFSLLETAADGNVLASSDGYRQNASNTNRAALRYLAKAPAGPLGLVMMDYAGVDRSAKRKVRGAKLVQKVIDQNFR